MTATGEIDIWEPNTSRRPGQRYDVRPHGTHARYERHRRDGEPACEACAQAERQYRILRRAAYIEADPTWRDRDNQRHQKTRAAKAGSPR